MLFEKVSRSLEKDTEHPLRVCITPPEWTEEKWAVRARGAPSAR